MTVRRPPPGAQISSGRIRVDAARAIAKLREYRLADPSTWILEAVRAAVASGATRIALTADADDVWLVWDGPPWPGDTLPDLFDELVSPEASRDVYHRRLLAGAINSGLGLEPAWIDIISVSSGKAARVRYTPATITPGEDGAAPLRDLDVDEVAVPEGARDPGMYLRLHRRTGLETLGRFLTGGEPPELAVARWACRDIAVSMTIGGLPVGRDVHGDDLLRVPLGESLDGFVALAHLTLLRGTPPVPAMDVAELGVRVVRQRWRPASLEAAWSKERATLPVRLVIDGPRMPTNASRSQVRAEDHPVAAAMRRGDQQVTALVEDIAKRLTTLPNESAEWATLRAAALAFLAPAISGPDWGGEAIALTGPLATLAKLPLVRNAVGLWRAPAEYWRGPIYRGREAAPRELSPWLGTMSWIPPGDAAEVLLGDARADPGDAKRAIKSARRRLQARSRFLSRPAEEAKVAPRAESRVRARLSAVLAGLAPAEAFEGLDGEVCVAHAPGPGRLTLHHEGRTLATAMLDTPLAIDAVVSGARLIPDERYTCVAIDGEFRRAQRAACIAAVRAIEALAGESARPGVEISAPRRASGDAELILIALSMARANGMRVDDDSPLAHADVFHAPDGVRYTLANLRARTVIGVIDRGIQIVPPAGRLLVLTSSAERKLLFELLGPGTAVVPYSARHAAVSADPGLQLAMMIAARTGTVALVRREGTLGGAIGLEPVGNESTLTMYHRGQSLAFVARQAAHVECAIAVDSDDFVPAEDWRSVRDEGGVDKTDLAVWERELLRATTRALLGDAHSPDVVIARRPVRIDDPTGLALCRALAEGDPGELLGPDLVARLRAEPMLHVLGRDELFSVDKLCSAFGDDLPVLSPDNVLDLAELGGWHPLVADHPLRGAVAGLSGRSVVDASHEIEERKRAVARRRKLEEHRQRPTEALALPPSCAPMPIPGGGTRGVFGIGEERRLEVVVLVEGRRFSRMVSSPDLPLRAVVELPVDVVDLERGEVGTLVTNRILGEIRTNAGSWLASVALERPEMLADDATTRALLAGWLTHAGEEARAVRDTLRAARAWPTIQGGRASLLAAAHGPTVPTADWSGDWLTGDPADPLDGPVLAVPSGAEGSALRAILDAIGPWHTDDVTSGVRRLQVRRRVAIGAVPSPTVQGAARELTRRIDELDVNHQLGAGEIALDDATESHVLLHFDGEYRVSLPLDVLPAVRIAIEAPELVDEMKQPGGIAAAHREQLARQVQELAVALVTAVAKVTELGMALPPWLRRRLATALLAQRLEPARVGDVPLFWTVTGVWMSWNNLLSQETMLGDIWYVTGNAPAAPLDNRRHVLAFTPAEATLASRLTGIVLVDGTRELTLDAQARANRGKPPLARLELPPQVRGGAMAVAELSTTASRRRGIVATLRPSAVAHRGLYACRGMVPFERVSDPCVWPTYALVEDPDLQGDRTWRKASEDTVWRSLVEDIQRTSEAALRAWLVAPADALTSELVDRWHIDRDSSLWDESLVRGVLWVDALGKNPRARGLVTVSTAHGDVEIDAPPESPLWGRLYAAPEPRGLVDAVRTLCVARYEAMARRAGVWRAPEREQEVDAQGVHQVHEKKAPTHAPPPLERPAHRLQPLVDAVRAQLEAVTPIALGIEMTIDRSRDAPALELTSFKRLVFAGQSELLVAVHEAREDRGTWADAAVEALAAHVMTLVNQARPAIDDGHERTAILRWLETP